MGLLSRPGEPRLLFGRPALIIVDQSSHDVNTPLVSTTTGGPSCPSTGRRDGQPGALDDVMGNLGRRSPSARAEVAGTSHIDSNKVRTMALMDFISRERRCSKPRKPTGKPAASCGSAC